jgi:hypothetical protein
MEKDAADCLSLPSHYRLTNPGTRRTSPAAYPTAYIPDYEQRQQAGLWIASTRVEKFNDWAVSARCQHRGMSWSPPGVLALAALEAARRNGELDEWRRVRELPERPLPEPVRQAA